jgi:hypothetical protein
MSLFYATKHVSSDWCAYKDKERKPMNKIMEKKDI